MKKLVLIDGHSILHRAFYGVPDLTNSEGLHTNAIYGFLNILFKILEEEAPDYPLITMAMGGLGAVSRISGQVFGSCMTFASFGKASAPGQLLLGDTSWILNQISESMEKRDEM